jgi:hypothetical protein
MDFDWCCLKGQRLRAKVKFWAARAARVSGHENSTKPGCKGGGRAGAAPLDAYKIQELRQRSVMVPEPAVNTTVSLRDCSTAPIHCGELSARKPGNSSMLAFQCQRSFPLSLCTFLLWYKHSYYEKVVYTLPTPLWTVNSSDLTGSRALWPMPIDAICRIKFSFTSYVSKVIIQRY